MKTKILKTLCLIAFLFVSNISFGQIKEETISWLEEKLNKYIAINERTHNYTIKITECEISINFIYDMTYYRSQVATTNRFQLKFPTDQTYIDNKGISTKGERIIQNNLSTGEKELTSSDTTFKLKEGEIDLAARVKKALDHLATFCPKKKETF